MSEEFEIAKKYVAEKLYPCFDYEQTWDLYLRSCLGVSFQAFASAVGNSRRVKLTDGRAPARKRK